MDTYEKKYKEIVGQIKKAYLYAQTDSTKEVLENIFPGLAENKDEKIRKALLDAMNEYTPDSIIWDDIRAEEIAAWLEKQAERKTPQWMIDFLDNYRRKIGCSLDHDEARDVEGKILCIIQWLEEQNGQEKDILEDCILDGSEDGLIAETIRFKNEKKSEQNTNDKVEPKFKVGDFIANDYCFGKVIALTDDAYLLDTEQGIPFSCEHNTHLWTIADAQSGDVLANDTIVLIVDHLGTFENRLIIYSWYFADSNKFYGEGPNEPDRWEVEGFHPATKEQRDLLFEKMHEAGYEWHANTKELKKIEQKKSYDTCDSSMMDNKKSPYSEKRDFGYFQQKPKFKVGDWCIDNEDGVIFQIVKVLDNTYTYKTNEGKEYSCSHYSLENDAHLWTIQDTKDGDILKEDSCIFILEKIKSQDTAITHCCLFDDGDFNLSSKICFDVDSTYPATKEQCTELFLKMHESGYEWDSEKKELKKIEKKSDSYCKEHCKGFQETGKCFADWECKAKREAEQELQLKEGKYYECVKSYHYIGCGEYWFDKDKVYFCEKDGYLRSDPYHLIKVDDCKNWQNYFRPYTENPAWSEEDETKRNALIGLVKEIKNQPLKRLEDWDEYINWLQSLEQRIGGKL